MFVEELSDLFLVDLELSDGAVDVFPARDSRQENTSRQISGSDSAGDEPKVIAQRHKTLFFVLFYCFSGRRQVHPHGGFLAQGHYDRFFGGAPGIVGDGQQVHLVHQH